MVQRHLQETLLAALHSMPVVAILGPRQAGKTTLALHVSGLTGKKTAYFDLESDADFNKFTDAEAFLKRHRDTLVILDEVQRKPDLFRLLRGIVDERKRNGEKAGQFLLLGSASRDLLQQSSESLAGRIRYLELSPFSFSELQQAEGLDFQPEKLWLRGGFPDSYMATSDTESWNWRHDFISTYLERDLPQMGVGIAPNNLRRMWRMLAHYHGNQVNFSELGRSLEMSHPTVKFHIDILTDFYMLRQLPPFAANLKKRLVKSPKIYLRDSGILHNLLNVSNIDSLLSHPGLGASWEGFAVENILSLLDSRWSFSYYRTATQIELDLVLELPFGEIWAVEIKRSAVPKPGRGFYEACRDVNAARRWIVTAGTDRYPLPDGVEVLGLADFLRVIADSNRLTK